MADFDLLKVKVKNRFISIIEKAPPLTKRRRLRYCASKSVQPFRLYACLRALKSYKKEKKKKKKHKTLYVGYMYLSPWKFFRNQILLDYSGRWRDQSCQIFFQSVHPGVSGKGSNFAIFSTNRRWPLQLLYYRTTVMSHLLIWPLMYIRLFFATLYNYNIEQQPTKLTCKRTQYYRVCWKKLDSSCWIQ